MKARTSFVTNSSSSSFIVLSTYIGKIDEGMDSISIAIDDLIKILENHKKQGAEYLNISAQEEYDG